MMHITKQELFGRQVFCLSNDALEIDCCPDDGMNLYRILYCGEHIADTDEYRMKQGATYGVPILFPTPNRVRDGQFCFEGKRYPAQMHGVVRREPFGYVQTGTEGDAVWIRGTLSVRKGEPLYDKFPFEYDLTVRISLYPNRIEYRFEVDNKGDCDLPFGIALHPFFRNEMGDAKLQFFSDRVMNMDENCLPDGSISEYCGAGVTLPARVSELDLNHVFMKPKSPCAKLWLSGAEVEIETGSSFTHLVVYTPQGMPFFCVEPQTCSTDAHNLYDRGFREEAGLLITKPKSMIQDKIVFRFR